MPPRAIETRYSGCRFRSRLEARWAVYLNAIKAKWVYEPEGFVLSDGTRYLPDFFVYHYDSDLIPEKREWGIWVEVKAVEPTRCEFDKMYRLCCESDHRGVIVFGRFPNIKTASVGRGGGSTYFNAPLDGTHVLPVTVSRIDLTPRIHHGAMALAAEARFEHGESPRA